jgi:glycosyltransferase involved in cell wall biosynthesis
MTADTVGGVWTYALELARALERHEVEVCLATMGAPVSAAQSDEAAEIPNLALFPSEYRLEWMPDPWDDVRRAGDWLLSLEARLRPDIVHLNGYAHGALPWRIPPLVVGHSCVLSWWSAVKGEAAPDSWRRYRDEAAAGLRAAGLVAAPTQAMLEALDIHYGPLPPSRVIANGRDQALFHAGAKEPFILSAGRLWDEAKNAAAMAAVAGAVSWPVCMAGEPQHPDGRPPENAGALRLLGALPPHELAEWLSRASIYALPARYEPFGLSILEAALSGCALVLGGIASLQEVWGDAALYVPPGDPAALRDALESLIADEALRLSLAHSALARARLYAPERMAGGYLAAYDFLRQQEASA